MKNLLIFILTVVLSAGSIAQNKHFIPLPISNDDFQQKLNAVNAKSDETAKLDAAKQIAQSNSLLTSQVKQMAIIFKSDVNRLDFAKAAFINTSDKINFYEVYDTFGYFSNVFKLHDFVRSHQADVPNETKKENKPAIIFPQWDYPDAMFYKDVKGCPTLIEDKDFDAVAKQINEMVNDAGKAKICEKNFHTYCMSTAQIMKITSLIKPESDRLNLLKKAFYHCYDVKNYIKAEVCLSNADNKKVLRDFITNGLTERSLYWPAFCAP